MDYQPAIANTCPSLSNVDDFLPTVGGVVGFLQQFSEPVDFDTLIKRCTGNPIIAQMLQLKLMTVLDAAIDQGLLQKLNGCYICVSQLGAQPHSQPEPEPMDVDE